MPPLTTKYPDKYCEAMDNHWLDVPSSIRLHESQLAPYLTVSRLDKKLESLMSGFCQI